MARRTNSNAVTERGEREEEVQGVIARNLPNATSIDTDRPTATVDTEEKKEKKGILKKIADLSPVKKVLAIGLPILLTAGIVLGSVFAFGGDKQPNNGTIDPPPPIVTPVDPSPSDEPSIVVGAPLTEDQKTAYAEKILEGSQVAGNYDPTTVKLEGTKLIENGDDDYLKAYISLTTNEGKDIMYAVGLDGITDESEIENATIRTNGKKKDITVYENISNHVTDATELESVKEFFKGDAGLDGIDKVYVDINKGSTAGLYSASIDYLAISGDALKTNTIEREGQKYNLTKAELLKEIAGLNKTADQELTK